MFNLVVLSALVACAVAAPGNLIAPVAPVVAAPAVAVPVATSYHNTYRAPVVKAAPLVAAAPVAIAHAAPVAVAHTAIAPAPVLIKSTPVVAAAPVAVAHAVAPAPLLVKHHAPVLVH